MEVIEKEAVKIKSVKANNKAADINLSVNNPSESKVVVSQLNTVINADSIKHDSTTKEKEITIIINPIKQGSLQETLQYHIGNDSLDELARLIKFKGSDISKIDYDKIVNILNFITIENSYDKLSNERVKILVELPNSKDYEKSMRAYYNLFKEGFIIISDKPFDEDFGELIYELDTLKISYVWKYLIDEIADFVVVDKSYGCGLIISDNINLKYHNGYFLFNPALYFEMDWEECLVDVIFNAIDLFIQHLGLYNETAMNFEVFKNRCIKILKAVLAKRINTKDIYNKTKEITRKKNN